MILKQTIYILALFLTGQGLYGQTIQGHIDYDKVVVALPQYAIGQKALEARRKQLNDSIATSVDSFMRILRTEMPHNVKMDSVSKALLEDTLIKFEKKIKDYQDYALNEIKKTQEAIEINLKNIVVKELKIYCANKNIVGFADNKSILYCKDCIDFTEDFVKYLRMKVE